MTGRFGGIRRNCSKACWLPLVAAIGCGGGGGAPAAGGTFGGGGTGLGGAGGGCPTSSDTGTLSIKITGTPSGVGLVSVAGQKVTVDADLSLTAGPQEVQASLVAEGGTIVRTAYAPSIDLATPCVRAGQDTTVNVAYAAIPTGGKLWLGATGTPAGATLLGYAPTAVAATGTASAALAANTFGSDGFTFDPFGNVWVTGGTTTDPPVARYPSSAFTTGGDQTPDVVIDSPSFGDGVPGPKVLAFDQDESLWVSVVAANKVVKFTLDQFGATGPTAAIEIDGIAAPSGIAFDASGNMWVAAGGAATVVRIDADHLTTSATGADLTITAQTASPVITTLSSPQGIAFDADGNLWVSYDGTLAALSPTDLDGTGAKTVAPAIQIVLDVEALPAGLAFDEEGGLWFAGSAGTFARLSPSQLAASGTPTPDIVITSPDLGYAGWFAIYPAPAFTPLAHALP